VSDGVVFVAMNGAILGLDAHTGKKLWAGSIGSVHWESPIVANSALYCSDENGTLSAFSL
jgi:outer membrane protein assembly factor BamB